MGRNYVPFGQDATDEATAALQKKAMDRQKALDSSMDFITGAVPVAPKAEDQVSKNAPTKDYPMRADPSKAHMREFEDTIYMSNNVRAKARGGEFEYRGNINSKS